MTDKINVTAIALAQLAQGSLETDADRIEALYLAINNIEFGTNLSVFEMLEYRKPELKTFKG